MRIRKISASTIMRWGIRYSFDEGYSELFFQVARFAVLCADVGDVGGCGCCPGTQGDESALHR